MRRALGLALLGLGFGGALAAQATAAVGGELTGQPFNTVLVPIAVDMSAAGGEKLGSYTARLTWSPAVLNFNFALAGNFPPPQLNTDSTGYGVLKFTSISPAGASGLVTVAQMSYTVADTVGSPLTLSFSELSAAGTFTNLLPGLTVTNATFCPSRGLWGDIDRDGAANSRDALLVLSKVVGLPVDTIIDTISTQPLTLDTLLFDSGLGDVNADGVVTSVDALIILSTAVGIPIPGQRVLILAPGGCGTGSPSTIVVFPGSAQLAPGQVYQLLAQGRDTAGRVVTLSNATWRSSNLDVAGVDADGTVHPRSAGTVVITAAVGPGVSAGATVTVAPRSKWYVDVAVTGAPVQFGNQAFPFDNPLRAFPVVQEGDTIAVASGTYDFVDYGILNVGVVIQGGTPGDTTTRPLFRDAQAGYHTALELDGGQRTVVQNVAFRNFSYAVNLQGVRTFALEDAKIEVTSGNYGSGVYACVSGTIDTVRVDRSVLLGDSTGGALENDYCVERTALVMVRDSKISGWDDGILWPDADSMVVLRSDVSDNFGYGINATQEYSETPSLYVAHSRIERNYYEAIYGYPLRRVEIDSSVIRAVDDDAIDVEGGCCGNPPLQMYLRGDSIYMSASGYSWLYTTKADSVVIDGTVVRFPADTAFSNADGYAEANVARITRSKFLYAGSGTVLRFNGRTFVADSVEMTGCAVPAPGCDLAAGFNLWPPSALDADVRRSRFSKIRYPVIAQGSGGGIHTFTRLVIDSADWGIQSYEADSAAVTDDSLARIVSGGIGIYSSGGAGRGPSLIARDTVACVPTAFGQKGFDFYSNAVIAESSLVTGCRQAVYAARMESGTRIRYNTIRAPYEGVIVDQTDTVAVRVDSNGVSSAGLAAVHVLGGQLLMTGNNVQGNAYGVQFSCSFYCGYLHQIHGNAFVSNTQYAISSTVDTVNAQQNWWGLSTGSHSGPGSDSAFGYVDTTNFLGAPPPNLPGLAPRLLATATPVRTTTTAAAISLAPAYRRSTPPAPRPVRLAPRQRPARTLALPPRMPAATVARLQEQMRRRAEHDAREAARRSTQ